MRQVRIGKEIEGWAVGNVKPGTTNDAEERERTLDIAKIFANVALERKGMLHRNVVLEFGKAITSRSGCVWFKARAQRI